MLRTVSKMAPVSAYLNRFRSVAKAALFVPVKVEEQPVVCRRFGVFATAVWAKPVARFENRFARYWEFSFSVDDPFPIHASQRIPVPPVRIGLCEELGYLWQPVTSKS